MQIKHIELKNFKFHHNLEFDIKQKNCLIYGENGTGKSSIYEALYSNFYHFKNKDIGAGRLDIREKYRHRDYPSEDMDINILFDNKDNLNRKDNDLDNDNILDNKVIYFANERVLREITEKNFYNIIQNILQEHFPQLSKLLHGYLVLKREEAEFNTEELISKRIELDKQFKIDFFKYIPLDIINDILIKSFDEKFEIDFEIENSIVEDKKLIYPQVSISIRGIDDRGDFKNHFNEAKLKLIGIAIYFALARKYETDSELKLLVLDDFLTSLDMANRKLIVQYILDNFGEYQKIILTHNIQFYNLIIRLLKLRKNDENNEELSEWDIKNIFIRKYENQEVSIISDREEDYLKKAKDELDNYNLSISGNYLRKEFERTSSEFEQLLELGRVEDLDKVLKAIKNLNYLFPEPSKNLNNIVVKFNNIINNNINTNDVKYAQLKDEIEVLDDKLNFRNDDLTFLKKTILKTEFYKDILMNSSLHDDTQKEFYTKEFQKSIKILEKLKKILKNLK